LPRYVGDFINKPSISQKNIRVMITHINQLDLNGTYSYADCLIWQLDDFVEIIKGKVYKMSPAPTRYHQDNSREIERPMANYFFKKNCKVYNAPFDVRFPLNE